MRWHLLSDICMYIVQYTLAKYGQVNGNMILNIKFATIFASSLPVGNVASLKVFMLNWALSLRTQYDPEEGQQTKAKKMYSSKFH